MSITTAKPSRPWKRTPKQIALNVLVLLASAAISFVVVLATEMKGKLAYLAIFFISVIVINFVENYFYRGIAAAKDSVSSSVAAAGLVIAVVPIFSILYTVFDYGRAGLNFTMFTKDMTLNGPNDPLGQGGLLHALIGTFIMVGIGLLISLPIGILTAIYLTEIKGIYSRPIRFLVQAMSGVPSIVAGLFILSAIVFPITQTPSGLMGSLALSILMIPTIARTSEEVLLLIPDDLREAGVALGGTQWRTVSLIVVPAAKSGLVTAIILGIARVAGETAPLILVTGGGDSINANPFESPMGSLPFYIWKGFIFGTTESIARAWAGIFVLLVIIFILFIAARMLSGSGSKK
jgi:phosphate transport system permease protein